MSFLFCCLMGSAEAQTDTLRVMAYNVLNYGQIPLCQGPNNVYHAYLDTIVQFANPDIIGLEKMGSIKSAPTDYSYSAEIDFQDSILKYALNKAFPGRYTYCPFTNNAHNNDFSMLFYDQNKLGFVAITCNYPSTEDFNTYKLYYKDPNLAVNNDTTFLYVTVNHDISGSGSATDRGAQIAGVMTQIKSKFAHLANMVNMGDFNVRNSYEPLYQTLTASADTNFRYYDPPFYPDAVLSYPADWDSNPNSFAAQLTTSTRYDGSIPNSCGTSGGGKNWYDHIFLSPWIINNANYIAYRPHSFRVIGNDGLRLGKSINSAPTNTSAPASVINSLFQMSNKYPVMVDLLVSRNTTGTSLPDPEGHTEYAANQIMQAEQLFILNPVNDQLTVQLSEALYGKTILIDCVDMVGRSRMHQSCFVNAGCIQLPNQLETGVYSLRISCDGVELARKTITRL